MEWLMLEFLGDVCFQDYTLHKTWHKNPNRKQIPGLSQSSWSVWPACSVFMLLLLVVVLWLCSSVSAGTVVVWGQLLLPAFFCTHKLDWCNALLCFHPSCLHTFLTWSHCFLLRFLYWYEGIFFLLVLLIACPVKGTVYAGRKILQSLEGLLW